MHRGEKTQGYAMKIVAKVHWERLRDIVKTDGTKDSSTLERGAIDATFERGYKRNT